MGIGMGAVLPPVVSPDVVDVTTEEIKWAITTYQSIGAQGKTEIDNIGKDFATRLCLDSIEEIEFAAAPDKRAFFDAVKDVAAPLGQRPPERIPPPPAEEAGPSGGPSGAASVVAASAAATVGVGPRDQSAADRQARETQAAVDRELLGAIAIPRPDVARMPQYSSSSGSSSGSSSEKADSDDDEKNAAGRDAGKGQDMGDDDDDDDDDILKPAAAAASAAAVADGPAASGTETRMDTEQLDAAPSKPLLNGVDEDDHMAAGEGDDAHGEAKTNGVEDVKMAAERERADDDVDMAAGEGASAAAIIANTKGAAAAAESTQHDEMLQFDDDE
mmetsp:Transcript_9942/g.28710  ORF Transcript_9942/g.28710 Transcript_9942/m.28710 type:complete len:331 (-) Transcript_9942:603-1595(-)